MAGGGTEEGTLPCFSDTIHGLGICMLDGVALSVSSLDASPVTATVGVDAGSLPVGLGDRTDGPGKGTPTMKWPSMR